MDLAPLPEQVPAEVWQGRSYSGWVGHYFLKLLHSIRHGVIFRESRGPRSSSLKLDMDTGHRQHRHLVCLEPGCSWVCRHAPNCCIMFGLQGSEFWGYHFGVELAAKSQMAWEKSPWIPLTSCQLFPLFSTFFSRTSYVSSFFIFQIRVQQGLNTWLQNIFHFQKNFK